MIRAVREALHPPNSPATHLSHRDWGGGGGKGRKGAAGRSSERRNPDIYGAHGSRRVCKEVIHWEVIHGWRVGCCCCRGGGSVRSL